MHEARYSPDGFVCLTSDLLLYDLHLHQTMQNKQKCPKSLASPPKMARDDLGRPGSTWDNLRRPGAWDDLGGLGATGVPCGDQSGAIGAIRDRLRRLGSSLDR